jgi:hypothetical protein
MNTTAPYAPKTVNCSSTLIPPAVVALHPSANSTGMAVAQATETLASFRRERQALGCTEHEPAHRAHRGERASRPSSLSRPCRPEIQENAAARS